MKPLLHGAPRVSAHSRVARLVPIVIARMLHRVHFSVRYSSTRARRRCAELVVQHTAAVILAAAAVVSCRPMLQAARHRARSYPPSSATIRRRSQDLARGRARAGRSGSPHCALAGPARGRQRRAGRRFLLLAVGHRARLRSPRRSPDVCSTMRSCPRAARASPSPRQPRDYLRIVMAAGRCFRALYGDPRHVRADPAMPARYLGRLLR